VLEQTLTALLEAIRGAPRSKEVTMISERLRFEAWVGSSAGVVILGVASEPASPETEICLLEGHDYTKMLRRNSDLKGF
jgi:hypothetical protein